MFLQWLRSFHYCVFMVLLHDVCFPCTQFSSKKSISSIYCISSLRHGTAGNGLRSNCLAYAAPDLRNRCTDRIQKRFTTRCRSVANALVLYVPNEEPQSYPDPGRSVALCWFSKKVRKQGSLYYSHINIYLPSAFQEFLESPSSWDEVGMSVPPVAR